MLTPPNYYFVLDPIRDSWFDERNRPRLNRITNKYTQKDQTEHLFRKAPGNFTWDVIPGACVPYEVERQYIILVLAKKSIFFKSNFFLLFTTSSVLQYRLEFNKCQETLFVFFYIYQWMTIIIICLSIDNNETLINSA